MCKYNVKDLFDVADDGIILSLYADYNTARCNCRKTLWDNFQHFWDDVNPIVPHNANLLVLGILNGDQIDAAFYDKGALLLAYTPNHPLLQMDDCSALSFDEVLHICRNEAFLPRITYEQLPWEVILGTEVDVHNVEACGMEKLAVDIIQGMTVWGFTAGENYQGWLHYSETAQKDLPHHVPLPAPEYTVNPKPQQAQERILREYLDGKIAEYHTVQEYLSRSSLR